MTEEKKKVQRDDEIDGKKFPYLKQVFDMDNEHAVWSTAIRKLKRRKDIKKFFVEYMGWLEENNPGEGEQIAHSNISYALGYFNVETALLWQSCIDNLMHPVFSCEPSETFNINPAVAFKTDMSSVKARKE